MKQTKNLEKKLNLSIMKLLEKAVLTDDYHLPVHHCSPQLLPKGLKLYRKCKSFTTPIYGGYNDAMYICAPHLRGNEYGCTYFIQKASHPGRMYMS